MYEEKKQALKSTNKKALDKLYRPSIPTLFTHKPRRRTNIPVSASQSRGDTHFRRRFQRRSPHHSGKLDAKAIKTIVKETAQQLSAVEGHSYTSTKLQ
ncbi:hypothetical protein [Rubritalea tangerina]|uniref:hypothetical protein n=1 Tax=Rubritalea tangerina TaxID=430798 RepID=UPI00361CD51A